MVMNKAQLISSLQNEVRILLHLADKVDAGSIDYRPTPKQRSTIEWLRYLTIMGPALATAAKTGTFDRDAWAAANKTASTMNLEEVKTALVALGPTLAMSNGLAMTAMMQPQTLPRKICRVCRAAVNAATTPICK